MIDEWKKSAKIAAGPAGPSQPKNLVKQEEDLAGLLVISDNSEEEVMKNTEVTKDTKGKESVVDALQIELEAQNRQLKIVTA